MDKCLINNGGCEQRRCINIPGGGLCDCKPGFSLKENSDTECEGGLNLQHNVFSSRLSHATLVLL